MTFTVQTEIAKKLSEYVSGRDFRFYKGTQYFNASNCVTKLTSALHQVYMELYRDFKEAGAEMLRKKLTELHSDVPAIEADPEFIESSPVLEQWSLPLAETLIKIYQLPKEVQ